MPTFSLLSLLPIFPWALALSPADFQGLSGPSVNIDTLINTTENANNTMVGDSPAEILCFNRPASGEQHLITHDTCERSLEQLWNRPLGDMPQYFRAHRGIVREVVLFSQLPCTVGIASEIEGDNIYLSIRDVLRAAERILHQCNEQRRGGVEYLRGGADRWVVFVMERTNSGGMRPMSA